MHRGFVPTEKDLNIALDVVEGVFAPMFEQKTEAEKLGDRVPPRAGRRPKLDFVSLQAGAARKATGPMAPGACTTCLLTAGHSSSPTRW